MRAWLKDDSATAREMQSQFEWAMHEPVALEVGVPAATIDMIRHGKPLADVPEKEAALIHLAREALGAKQVTPATYATALALFGEEELLHYSVLIASYAQGAILLCIVGRHSLSPVAGIAGAGRAFQKVLRRKHRCQKPFLRTIGCRCGALHRLERDGAEPSASEYTGELEGGTSWLRNVCFPGS